MQSYKIKICLLQIPGNWSRIQEIFCYDRERSVSKDKASEAKLTIF